MQDQIQIPPSLEPNHNLMLITYGLFGLGILFGGLPTIAGVILAYIKRNEVAGFHRDHLLFLIRTFWGTVIGFVAGFVLSIIGIGIAIIWAISIWYIFRVIYGAVKFFENKTVTTTGWLM